MPPDKSVLLGFDTSAAHCAAVLLCGDEIIGQFSAELGRQQVEKLMPMLEALLSDASLNWQDITALAVCTGPGNFTGTRIGVSAARGLAMSLDIPALGVSVFEAAAMAASTWPESKNQIRVEISLPRGKSAKQVFADGAPPSAVGSPQLLHQTSAKVSAFDITDLARFARLVFAKNLTVPRPAPFYLTSAEAAPARDKPPLILDDI